MINYSAVILVAFLTWALMKESHQKWNALENVKRQSFGNLIIVNRSISAAYAWLISSVDQSSMPLVLLMMVK